MLLQVVILLGLQRPACTDVRAHGLLDVGVAFSLRTGNDLRTLGGVKPLRGQVQRVLHALLPGPLDRPPALGELLLQTNQSEVQRVSLVGQHPQLVHVLALLALHPFLVVGQLLLSLGGDVRNLFSKNIIHVVKALAVGLTRSAHGSLDGRGASLNLADSVPMSSVLQNR